MSKPGFDALFEPRSIAVVGASSKQGSVGKAVMDNLVEARFKGKLYPVNVKPIEIHGLKSYPSLLAIDDSIDLVLIMVPAAAVKDVLEHAGKKEIKAAVIISAGFKEAGSLGATLEKEVAQIAEHYGITLIGPNCIGVLNPHHQLNASFAGSNATKGDIAVVSQSGALGTAFLDLARQQGIGFSKFITIGNKASLHELDLLNYLAKDQSTKVIAMYVESFSPSPTWVTEVRRITSVGHTAKPIVVLKAGKTDAGRVAAKSHTGSLAGDDAVYSAFFKQAGIIEVSSMEELLMVAQALHNTALIRDEAITIVTNAGGPGILATDAATNVGLIRSVLDPNTIKQIENILPTAASVRNPIDVLGDADAARYESVLDIVMKDQNCGGVLAIVTPQAMTNVSSFAESFIRIKKKHPDVPFVVSLVGGELMTVAKNQLRESHITVVDYPELGAVILAALAKYGSLKARVGLHYSHVQANNKVVDDAIVSALHARRTALSALEVQDALNAYHIPHVRAQIAKTAIEATRIAHTIGKPVALKIVSPDVLHKTDAGGVALSLLPSEVTQEFTQIIERVKRHTPHARIDGVLVQEMVPLANEMIVGAKRDPVFGPVTLIGLGGIYVEILKDSALRIAPVALTEAREMLSELKYSPVLFGARGQEALDTEAIEDVIVKTAELMINHPEITEIDLNPLVVNNAGKGVEVLDARILISA